MQLKVELCGRQDANVIILTSHKRIFSLLFHMSYISFFLCRLGIQSNLPCCPKCRQSVLLCFPLDPAVSLDVWRRIKQLPDPHSRQLTLLWMPVNIAGFLRKNFNCNFTRAAFRLTTRFSVFSVFPALLPTPSSEVTWWSGHRRARSGSGGGTVEKPRQSSPSAQDGVRSPSSLWSTRAPTSLLT